MKDIKGIEQAYETSASREATTVPGPSGSTAGVGNVNLVVKSTSQY